MFNNGESCLIDFKKLFNDWKINSDNIEFPLLTPKEFGKNKIAKLYLILG